MGCGCKKPAEWLYEYKILDTISINTDTTPCCLELFYEDTLDLKDKVICNFLDILNQLECGKHPDLDETNFYIMKIESTSIAKSCNKFNPNEFLRRANYLSEFNTLPEKSEAVKNLGLYDTIILTENNYELLLKQEENGIKDNTLYFVISDEEYLGEEEEEEIVDLP